jgi:hypothetical protein
MIDKKIKLAQEFIDEQAAIELVLTKQQVLEVIAVLAKEGALAVPTEEVLVMHFLTSKVQSKSALLSGVYMPRATLISHVERAPITEHVKVLNHDRDIHAIAKWLDFLDN